MIRAPQALMSTRSASGSSWSIARWRSTVSTLARSQNARTARFSAPSGVRGKVAVDRDLLDRRLDRRGVEPAVAHERDLGGKRPQCDLMPAPVKFVEDWRDRKQVAPGRGRVGQDSA